MSFANAFNNTSPAPPLNVDALTCYGQASCLQNLSVSGNNLTTGNYTCGGRYFCSSALNAGSASLVAGTVTVSNPALGLNPNSVILCTPKFNATGVVCAKALNATSFIIYSSNGADAGSVSYLILN